MKNLAPGQINVYSLTLAISNEEEAAKRLLLSQDEKKRADRFLSPLHRKRFIAARSSLRTILSTYLNMPPETLTFVYSAHHKPAIAGSNIQFNLSHSEDLAVIAISAGQMVGIDIEKIIDRDIEGIAQRFFSPKENTELERLSPEDRMEGFYRLWSRKEALIKAIGKGLSIPLSHFSVSLETTLEKITLEHETWALVSLSLHPGYQTALACQQNLKKAQCWSFIDQIEKLDNEYEW